MRNALFALTLLFCLLSVGQMQGQPPPSTPIIYVSIVGNPTIPQDGTILEVDGGVATTIFTGGGSRPEDLVVGPDDKIYVCFSLDGQIRRMDQDGTNVETVYSFSSFPDPELPEGPSFLGDDLYFNTRAPNHEGVWKIPGIASIGGGPFPAPVQVLTSGQTGISNFGEGTSFDLNGNLLIVDRSGGRVLRSAPPFTSVTSIISGLVGVGVHAAVVNSTGDIFVSNTNARTITQYGPNGGSPSPFVDFLSEPVNEFPMFMEFDAADNLYVATISTSSPPIAAGKVWQVDTTGAKTLLATILTSQQIVGLAVPATADVEEQTFSFGDDEQIFDFGSHTFKIQNTVGSSCDVTVTATQVSPKDLNLRLPGGTKCVRYFSQGGYCIVYEVGPLDQFGLPSCFTDTGNTITIGYFSSGATALPVMVHDSSQIGGTSFAALATEYFPDGVPGDDPMMRGSTRNFQEFAAAEEPLVQLGEFGGFEKPLLENSTHQAGRTIPVKFRLTDAFGDAITDANAFIAVAKVEPAFEIQEIRSQANDGNRFRYDPEDELYIFNLSTKGYTPGTYSLTVTSDSFPPQSIRFQLR